MHWGAASLSVLSDFLLTQDILENVHNRLRFPVDGLAGLPKFDPTPNLPTHNGERQGCQCIEQQLLRKGEVQELLAGRIHVLLSLI